MSKKAMRIVSFVMLILAIAFLAFALTHPEAGTAFVIFGITIGSDVWRVFYAIYALVTVGLFATSFFVKGKIKS